MYTVFEKPVHMYCLRTVRAVTTSQVFFTPFLHVILHSHPLRRRLPAREKAFPLQLSSLSCQEAYWEEALVLPNLPMHISACTTFAVGKTEEQIYFF
jgi:hypothetical protein